jgi:curved DNA-binding protein CbpA
MSPSAPDPYETLEVAADASDEEVRAAYRRLVQRHHPDHNGGSVESARRFEEVQEAYARIRELRRTGAARGPASGGRAAPRSRPASGGRRTGSSAAGAGAPDPTLEARLAEIQRELQEAQQARERAVRAAREAAASARDAVAGARDAASGARAKRPGRASDEELGYVSTDDSFGKILADVRDELAERLTEARETPVGRRVSGVIDDLDEIASKLTGEAFEHRRKPDDKPDAKRKD